jgi:chorismate mutase / prephenate dehydratase
MDTTAPPLDNLRAEIDKIDQQILDLLIERSAVVRLIGDVKGDRLDGRSALRPAREAQILRRLAERARGRFPTAVLVRMWRELLAAHTRLQTPLSVAVFAREEDAQRIWDLARDHFGSATPMTQVDRPIQALRALGDGSATVAVLPLPGDDESWWVALMSDQDPRLRVFARLPFVTGSSTDGDEVSAFAIGELDVEASGADLTLLAIEAEPSLSRGRLRDLLVAAGLEPGWAAAWRPPSPPQALHLVEVDSFVGDGDGRITDLRKAARGEVLRVMPVGGYARPLRPDGKL